MPFIFIFEQCNFILTIFYSKKIKHISVRYLLSKNLIKTPPENLTLGMISPSASV